MKNATLSKSMEIGLALFSTWRNTRSYSLTWRNWSPSGRSTKPNPLGRRLYRLNKLCPRLNVARHELLPLYTTSRPKRTRPTNLCRIPPCPRRHSRACRKPSATGLSQGRDGGRFRVGDFRVVYEINDKQRDVTVFHIGHRRDVYR